jgi:S-formylglutathione hydrolase FrmB
MIIPFYQVTHLHPGYIQLGIEEGPGKHDWDFWDTYIQRGLDWLPIQKASQSQGNKLSA